MGLFDKLFGKEKCVLCGAEVGAMHRDKIKDKQYICNECAKKCSAYVRLSEMDKPAIEEHINFMANREKIYQNSFTGTTLYPSTVKHYAIKFSKDAGMLAVIDQKNNKGKINHEVIRYDEIASYEYYKEMNRPTQQGGQETFKEDGVILHLVQPFGYNSDMEQKGLRVHPYIKQDIKLCFRTSEKETDYAKNALQHLDGIFGVHSHDHALFGGMTTAAKRDLKAKVDMAKLMGGAVKAAVKGESGEGLQDKFVAAQNSAADALSDGLAVYSRRADEAEAKVNG